MQLPYQGLSLAKTKRFQPFVTRVSNSSMPALAVNKHQDALEKAQNGFANTYQYTEMLGFSTKVLPKRLFEPKTLDLQSKRLTSSLGSDCEWVTGCRKTV
jgi:hypothetical protein